MANPFDDDRGDTPPRYRIDLSLPPSERYVALAKRYRRQLRSLTTLFDELVLSIHPRVPLKLVHRLARLFLRRLYTREETEEIQGIGKATGISLYFLVALNVVLDLLMGCTSGAVRSKERGNSEPKMLHFRTLDWGMDSLRQLVVQLDFFRSTESDETIATSVTYVGFVGVLTGVRRHLSVSLNFRPNHDSSGFGSNFRYYSSHVLVLLGIRQSISSLFRQYIIPPTQRRERFLSRNAFWRKESPNSGPISLASIASTLPTTPTTAAYLIFSDGLSALTLEKDYKSATVQSSSSFIVATNCDASAGATLDPKSVGEGSSNFGLEMVTGVSVAMADLIEESDERRRCIQARWDKKVHQAKTSHKRNRNSTPKPRNHRYPTRERSSRHDPQTSRDNDEAIGAAYSSTTSVSIPEPTNSDVPKDTDVSASRSEIIDWVMAYPITNECTHYSTVMDPIKGTIAWLKRYREPITAELN